MSFSSLFFSNLFGLSLLGALPFLALAYLKKNPKNAVTVSTLLILEKLSRQRTLKRRRVKLPLRFFLELLALLLLALAVASPMSKPEAEHVAVILDSSLSMQATESNTKATRFNLAVEKIRQWLSIQSIDTEYTLFSSAPNLEQRGKARLKSRELEQELGSILASNSSDSLGASVDELARSGKYNRVLVVSDKEFQAINPTTELFSTLGKEVTSITAITVGSQTDNLYFSSVSVERAPELSSQRKLTATVAFSGQGEVSFRVLAKGSKSSVAFAQTNITLKSDSSTTIEIPIPLENASENSFLLSLDGITQANKNSISVDDIAWASIERASSSKILLVSPTLPLDSDLGLESLLGFGVTRISEADFESYSKEDLENYSLVVVHKSKFPKILSRPVFGIVPTDGAEAFSFAGVSENPLVTSWSENHPVMSYLKVPLLKPVQSIVFTPSFWLQQLVSAEDGPVVLAGETKGVRALISGFELLPFEGRKTPVVSIFTLNSFNWLLGGQELVTDALTGTSLKQSGESTWIVQTPLGEVETYEGSTSVDTFIPLKQAGIYQITTVSSDASKNISRKTSSFAVNTFYPTESSTHQQAVLSAPAQIVHERPREESASAHWRMLVFAAMVILIIESILLLVSKNDSGETLSSL